MDFPRRQGAFWYHHWVSVHGREQRAESDALDIVLTRGGPKPGGTGQQSG